jgi:Reverse transcriptase (RNA-dependent DNA polymerase)/Endonuclease-reverse transcriptase
MDSFECRLEFSATTFIFGGKRFLILLLYRPSNPLNNADFEFFYQELEKAVGRLQKKFCKKKLDHFMVCGDFNINVHSTSANARKLLLLMQQFNMKLLNDQSMTRANDNNGTQIDLIFGSSTLTDHVCFVRSNNFSDHETVLLRLNVTEQVRGDCIRSERNFSDQELRKFECYLNAQDWRAVAVAGSVDSKCNEFMRIFLQGFHICFPMRRRLYRANQIGKISLSPLIKSQRQRLYDFRCLLRGVTDASMRDVLRRQAKELKFSYLQQLEKEIKAKHNEVIARASNKSKAAWRLINDGISAGGQFFTPIQLLQDGVCVEEAQGVAEILNDKFVVPLPENVHYDSGSISHLRLAESMFLTPVGEQEILHFVKQMPAKKSCGVDGVPMFLVKKIASFIAAPLADIFSASFAQGVYPDCFKQAVVVPIFKKGNRQDSSNYRPISNLPTFSKILENCFLVRVADFFHDKKLLPSSQHGFLKGRGTQTALFEFMRNLFQNLEKRQRVLTIFYDLSNAFGKICPSIVIEKFELLGVRGLAGAWLSSALTGRSQCVKLQEFVGKQIKDVFSSFLPVHRGTPQGGIISPFVFDIGIFDMAILVLIGVLLNYADDSSSLITAPSNDRLFAEARAAADLMRSYCDANFLTLNAEKSVILCFRSGNARLPDLSPYVPINGKSVQCSHNKILRPLHL